MLREQRQRTSPRQPNQQELAMMLTALIPCNDELRIDSRIIAKEIGESHKALYRLMKHNAFDFRRFGILPFETGPLPLRGKPERFAYLNREQIDRLLTYLDDTPEVRAFRASLDEAFGTQPATGQPAMATAAGAALMPFSFESRQIRAFNIDGNPWFVGKDVCDILGYANHNDAMTRHCRGVVKRYPIVDRLGRTQEVRILNEPDVYRLVAGSTLPEAMRFEAWLFEEVLPEIRKTGSYALPGAQPGFARPWPVSAALRSSINRHAWRLAQDSYDAWRDAMLSEAQRNPAFNPERWTPVDCFPAALNEPDFADRARELVLNSSYRARNPQRDYEVLKLRLAGLSYREIGAELGMSQAYAWRIVARNAGRVAL
jgi:hypothetical protein